MKTRSAFVTITAKVFIPEDEIEALAQEGKATILSEGDTPITSEQEALEFLAQGLVSSELINNTSIQHNEITVHRY